MRKILIDTNLLVLFVIGSHDVGLIRKHKRANTFTEESYELLVILLSSYSRIVVTPHILAEANSLVSLIGSPVKEELRATLGRLASTLLEVHIPVGDIFSFPEFSKYGITDAAILSLKEEIDDIYTVDLDLYLAGLEKDLNVFNFRHIDS